MEMRRHSFCIFGINVLTHSREEPGFLNFF